MTKIVLGSRKSANKKITIPKAKSGTLGEHGEQSKNQIEEYIFAKPKQPQE